jgi:hypothetical protein
MKNLPITVIAMLMVLVVFTCFQAKAGCQVATTHNPSTGSDTNQASTAEQEDPSKGSTKQTLDEQNPELQNKTEVAATAQEIANQANNPAAPLSLIQFRNILLPSVSGTDGATNAFQIQPVLPIGPFRSFGLVQLVKITMEFPTLPGPAGGTGFGDFQLFDLISIKQSWGRWGFGPALVFPTASSEDFGAGKWQAGPAVALIYTRIENLTAGAVLQNPISYAGSPDRPRVNNLIITPTFTYNLKEGWFVGLSDYNWTINWEDGGAATIPLGIQVGKVLTIGKQPFSASIEVGGAAVRPDDAPNPGWIVGFEFTPIFNWHLGHRKYVRVRIKK